MRRALAELAATLAALAALALFGQLRDPTSPLRLRLAEWGDELRERRIRFRGRGLVEEAELLTTTTSEEGG